MNAAQLILVVEDDSDMASLVKYHLHREGHRTVVAVDGRAALNLVFERKPDLVILDLMLPHLHGYEVCRLAKSAAATREIPILMLSALGSLQDKLKGFHLGADDYLTKPCEISELMVRVRALLQRTGPRQPPTGPLRRNLPR